MIIDACRIEHVISQETFSKLKEHAEKMMALQAKREQEQAKEQQ